MNDLPKVRGLERLGNLSRDLERMIDRHRASRQPIGQRFALDKLEHESVRTVWRALRRIRDTVDGRDVGMAERGEERASRSKRATRSRSA